MIRTRLILSILTLFAPGCATRLALPTQSPLVPPQSVKNTVILDVLFVRYSPDDREFRGRTPRLQNVPGGGRDHWSAAYTCLFAGGGIARGRAVGRTDRVAGSVLERPVSPKDVLATTYHLLGIDPETTLTDRGGRPLPLVGGGAVVGEMLA